MRGPDVPFGFRSISHFAANVQFGWRSRHRRRRALAAHAFAYTPFQRLEAPVFAWNPASMRVLEKAGFTREALLRHSAFKDGQLIDTVLYTRLRE